MEKLKIENLYIIVRRVGSMTRLCEPASELATFVAVPMAYLLRNLFYGGLRINKSGIFR